MEIKVKRLGLAAYVKMCGAGFIAHEKDKSTGRYVFVFESDKSLPEWEVEYANSCCSLHDSEVMSLRKFMK
jgi:hypothetical protein